MVKYKSELKVQIVHEYLSTSQSTCDLSQKYQINKREIAKWIQRYRLNGIDGLKRRRKRTFTTDFRLNVIDYYQTHEDPMAEVAARFDILTAQVSVWRSQFERDGITALESLPKGRPSKMKRTKKQIRQLANKSELERLKEELAKKSRTLWHQAGAWSLKKIAVPVRTLKARKKTQIVDQIRDDQSQRPKKLRYKISDLLQAIGLAKATYHNERKRIARSHDKYEEAKAQILKIAQWFRLRGRWTVIVVFKWS